jgi:hypothetical protein
MAKSRIQAVLLIHGIGEQRPMDTLRGFVQEAWVRNTKAHRKGPKADAVWNKPYTLSENFELRRLTTGVNAEGIRTDFFEFYWAHLMHGTKPGHVLAWAAGLLLRPSGKVPAHLRGAYWFLWLVIVSVAASAAYFAFGPSVPRFPPWLPLVASTLVLPFIYWGMRKVVGDAARYLHVAATNVHRRHEIRAAGVKALKSLHEQGYDRILIVGHSLGTVIGYDILSHAWAGWNAEILEAPQVHAERDAFNELVAGESPPDPDAMRAAQGRCFREAVANGSTWRVSDFITLGSPLAHAEILLARDRDELRTKFEEREFPRCPPQLEEMQVAGATVKSFSYDTKEGSFLHQAAPFALTRWTNLYFPAKALVSGDLVGGPVAPVFGAAVKDVPVKTGKWGGLFSHTFYWAPHGKDTHVDALRDAVNLLDTDAA